MSEHQIEIYLIAGGTRLDHLGKKFKVFYEISKEDFLRRDNKDEFIPTVQREYPMSKSIKTFMGGTPGVIYKVNSTKGSTSIFPGTAKYCGRWRKNDIAIEWAAEEKVAMAEFDANKKSKIDIFKENLKPIRDAYWGMTSLQRGMLLSKIVQFICTRP